MNKLRVVHLTSSRFFGGPERQMLGLAQSLAPDIDTQFLSFSEGGLCADFLARCLKAGFKAGMLQHDTPHLISADRELTFVLKSASPDLLICHGYKANLLGKFAARRLNIPVISVSRGWTGESRRVRLFEAIDRRTIGWMDRVVCVSESQAEKVRRAGVPGDKITVIHNAIQLERFGNPKPDYRERLARMFPSRVRTIVGAAGRLSPEKGFDVLIDAAAFVIKSVPDAGFVLFGDGALRETLAARIARGLEERITLAGFHHDLDDFLPHIDLFVQSSHTEGLPNVILEAMAAGVPVVATAVGGTPEIIDDGMNGRLVPPGNVQSLADAIISTADAKASARFTDCARAKLDAQFTFAAQAVAYRELFNQLGLQDGRPSVGVPVAAMPPKIKVLLLVDDIYRREGGTEQHLMFLQRSLPRERLDVHFGVLSRVQRMDPAEFPVPPHLFCSNGRHGVLEPFARLRRLVSNIKKAEIDVVHAFCRTSELYACLAVRLAGPRGKVLAVRRNMGYWHTWRSRWTARLIGCLGASYAANCEAAKEYAACIEWISPMRITVIPNPVSRSRLEDGLNNIELKSSLGVQEGEQVVGIVATLRPVKDYATFLHAARLVLDAHPQTRFLVVGSQEPEYGSQMRQLGRDLGVERQISWLGPMSNPLRVIPLFDVAVLSSRSEAMSNSIVEYCAAGVATVATDVGGTREILDDETTGFLVPPGNNEYMAKRINQLLLDRQLRTKIGERGRCKAHNQFAEEAVIAAYMSLYDRLASDKGGRK